MTGTLTAVTSTIFTFNGGTVSVPTQGAAFQNLKLDGGFVSIRAGSIGIEATLLPGSMGGSPGVIDGSTSFDYHFSGTHLTQGSAGVQLEVPEPGTLEGLLLGIGVFGLAGMKRRKLQLGT
jgi:hypothetical protein